MQYKAGFNKCWESSLEDRECIACSHGENLQFLQIIKKQENFQSPNFGVSNTLPAVIPRQVCHLHNGGVGAGH